MDTSREPLVVRGAVVALVDALIHLLVVFGVVLTAAQVEAVSGFVNVASVVAVVVWSRGKVTPVANPDTGVAEAAAIAAGGSAGQ